MSHISRVQFPRGNSKGSNNIIRYKEDIIKSVIKEHEAIQPRFQRIQNQNSGQLSLFDTAIQQSLFQQEQIFQPQTETGQSVQLEIGLSYDQKSVEKKKEEKRQAEGITDTGDSLLSNLKKNKKQYTWQELANIVLLSKLIQRLFDNFYKFIIH